MHTSTLTDPALEIEIYREPETVLLNHFDIEILVEKPRVLIVDDSATVRAQLRRTLRESYDCTEVATVLEAFEELKSAKYAVIIADIIIPGLSGIELLRRAVEEYPGIAVIMVSGVDRPQRALDALRLGAFDYIIKPFDPYSLQLTVERALDHCELVLNAEKYKADLEARNLELAERTAELENLQVQMVQNAKMASLGRLAAGVAHEVNNPVGFIYSNLDLLEKDLTAMTEIIQFLDAVELPEGIRRSLAALRSRLRFISDGSQTGDMIRDCMEGAQRIRSIVQNLRTFSRLDEADLSASNINEGIDSTIRILSRYFSNANVQLYRNFGDLPLVESFAGQLNQVWMNILANAAQALPAEGGDVTVTTVRDGDWITVEITDSGKGMPAEDLDRIFDPFFTTKELGEGTGLGLSISFGIVQKHNGTISVRSRPGEGTTFTVRLPISMRGEQEE
ncbi:MAG: ATP-binding protein [Pyrinomonadaceae bacterium]